jgi:hypothetical protein
MDTVATVEKTSGRVERRTAYTSGDIGWLSGKEEWEGLACIGAVNAQVFSKKGETNEWQYYICSRGLTAEELLRHARLEWPVEKQCIGYLTCISIRVSAVLGIGTSSKT